MVSTPTSVPVSAEEIVETARGLKEQMDSIKAVIGSSRVDWDNSELQALQSDWNEAMSAVNTVLRTSSAVGTSPELANKMNKHVDTVKKVYEVINQLAPEIGNLMSDTQGAISGLGGALSNIFEGMTPKNLAEMAAERGGRIANYFGLHPGNKTKLASNLMEKTGEETAKMDYNEAARAREATKMYDIRPQEILYKIGRNKDRIDSFYSQILGMKGLSAAGENEAALIMSTQGKIERNSTDIQTKEGEKSTAETRLGDLEQREVDLGELKGKKDAFENGKVMDGSSEWNHDSAVEENQNQIKKIKDTDIPALTGEITQLKANDGNLKSQLQQQQTMAEKNRSERNAEKNNSEVAKLSVEEMQFANEQIAALKKENTSLEIDYNVLTMPGFKPKATWIMHKTKNAVMDALTADVTKDSAKW
ncbi:hypothetical protein HON22_01135, partial [Candidatus Peregrinibacteria bacterium]|nr:hypothetical protein [Candidatus Peregrinibacteria bacterium]